MFPLKEKKSETKAFGVNSASSTMSMLVYADCEGSQHMIYIIEHQSI